MPAILLSAVISLLLTQAGAPMQTSQTEWEPMRGDRLIVNTETNAGALVREDGTAFTTFPVITGQKRWVHYIGRTYDAQTPDRRWVVRSRHIKGDRTTFGPSGRFLRLYGEGEEYTSYGIHEHRDETDMFARDDRFQSMGCIIVQRTIMDIIENTYLQNGGTLDVVTLKGNVPYTSIWPSRRGG